MNSRIITLGVFFLAGVLGCSTASQRTATTHTLEPLLIAKQGYFFVGGKYVDRPNGRIMAGQMYVQFQIPQQLRHPYPIVMIHGGGQTGTNFLGTPDGRPGWADFFLSEGYAVYVVDQPGRGRSVYHAEIYGPINQRATVQGAEQRFTKYLYEVSGEGHSRERPYDDAREEQSRDRGVDGQMVERERQIIERFPNLPARTATPKIFFYRP